MIFSEKTKTKHIIKEQVWAAWLRVRSHHTKKTKVVHCYKSSRRRSTDKTFPVTFDFLGYKFCPISIPP